MKPIIEKRSTNVNQGRANWLSNPIKRSLITAIAASTLSCLYLSEATARVRAMNFAMDQIESEQVHASAHGMGCVNGLHELSQTSNGTMIYQRTIDQTMIDQMNAVMSVGGTSRITFTLRTGLSVFGAGNAFVDGTVTVSVAGNTIATITESTEAPPGGTTSTQHDIPIDPSIIGGMSVGGSITVTATGTGQAYANACGTANQAIATWYFTHGGKPTIGTNPY